MLFKTFLHGKCDTPNYKNRISPGHLCGNTITQIRPNMCKPNTEFLWPQPMDSYYRQNIYGPGLRIHIIGVANGLDTFSMGGLQVTTHGYRSHLLNMPDKHNPHQDIFPSHKNRNTRLKQPSYLWLFKAFERAIMNYIL